MMPPTKPNTGKTREAVKSRMGGACPAKPAAPMQGRMGRMQVRMGRMQSAGMKQPVNGRKIYGMKGRCHNVGKIPFQSVKSDKKKRAMRAKKISPESILSGNKTQDEALLKLRIPLLICSGLPSIKKFTAKSKSTKGKKLTNMHFETEAESIADQEQHNPHCFPVVKKRKYDYVKYTISIAKERRFQAMLWDIGFTMCGDIVITCSEGAMLCDSQLNVKNKFPNMFLPGAVAFFSDDRILIVDRSSDTVNVYQQNALFIRSFIAGKCPMGMVVTPQNEVFVSDTGDKCVRKFDMLGRHLLTIPRIGDGYTLQWPLYLSLSLNQDIYVSDVHQQKVLEFNKEGKFSQICSLKTQSGSSVLRPHGVCVTKDNELVVIDTSIDSVEIFSAGGTFQQTLINPDEGLAIEPKLCKLSMNNDLLVIGGMKGITRLYNITVNPPLPELPNPNSHKAGAAMLRRSLSQVKEEIEHEPTDQLGNNILTV